MREPKEFNTDDLKHLTENLTKANKAVKDMSLAFKMASIILGILGGLWLIALILSPVLIDIGLIKYLFF